MIYITTFVGLSHSDSHFISWGGWCQSSSAQQGRRVSNCQSGPCNTPTVSRHSGHPQPHLVSPSVQVHHQVLRLGVSVPHLALVAVWVPGHFLWNVAILLVLLQELVILWVLYWAGLERLSEDHWGLAWPGDGGRPSYGAVPGYGGIVLDAEQRVGRIKVVVMDRTGGGGWARGDTTWN